MGNSVIHTNSEGGNSGTSCMLCCVLVLVQEKEKKTMREICSSAPFVAFVAPRSIDADALAFARGSNCASFAVAAALENALQGQRDAVGLAGALTFKKLVLGDLSSN